MPRREFPAAVQRAALERSGFLCEAVDPDGLRCIVPVGRGRPVEYDHVIPDWMGGEPTLVNCAALCKLCHAIKTRKDAADRAEARHRSDAHDGIRDPHRRRLQGRGFDRTAKRHSATAAIPKLALGYRRPDA